jgi:type II secretory pathway predicted ATPase ExeA
LRDKLSRPELRQFAQRISVDYHLTPLGRAETHAYIRHRLQVADGNPDLFQPAAIEFMFSQTRGVPRLLNRLADFALVYAFADQRATIDEGLIADVLRDQAGRQGTCEDPLTDAPGRIDQRRRRVKSSQ